MAATGATPEDDPLVGDLDPRRLDSWIEISESAYAGNLDFFRRLVGDDVELSVVVKANAYGHGLEDVARLAVRHGADSFCVHSLDEALALRRAGLDEDVLIMGHVPLARLEEVVAADFRLVLFHLESARRLAEITGETHRSVRVHLKIETGTHRQGVDGEELGALIGFLAEHPRLDLDGVYTHFANVEDTTEHEYARRQIDRFEEALERIVSAGLEPRRRHAACSAAAALFPRSHYDMVRLGISQYGFWSSKETRLSYLERSLERPDGGGAGEAEVLRPVLTWKTRVSQVKSVPADAFVGYGCTYQTTRETRLAILPVGYSDGYDRHLSNAGHVLIRGRRAPVRGRVCMNLLMVDVTDVPGVSVEEEAVLLGRQEADGRVDEVTADDLAALVGTISYEIVARLSRHIPRIVVD